MPHKLKSRSRQKKTKTSRMPKLSRKAKSVIKQKSRGSKKFANTVTVDEGKYKVTLLKFHKKQGKLYVKISRRSGNHSKYLGDFKA